MDVTTRHADLETMAALLQTQRAQRHDLIVPSTALRADGGTLRVEGDRLEVLNEDGVSVVDSPAYRVTDVAEEGISDKLGIPRAYLRKMRATHPALWDQNVNGWLQHDTQAGTKHLLRTLRDSDTGEGVARALLSNKHKAIENLDVLVAAMEGVRDAGAEVTVTRCDLTDRRMIVTLHAPSIAVEAERLLDGYRGPWHVDSIAERRILAPEDLAGERQRLGAHHMYERGQEPIIFGGLQLGNSDVGCGAFSLSSQLLVARCTNGLTIPAGKVRKVHLGKRQEDVGAVDWSRRTIEAELALVRSQTRDAVQAFLSTDWVREQVSALEERAGVAVTDAAATVAHVTKALAYDEDRAADVLSHFIAGGQQTAGGVMHAVTSVAQTVRDGDDAAQMEADGVRALDLAAAFAS